MKNKIYEILQDETVGNTIKLYRISDIVSPEIKPRDKIKIGKASYVVILHAGELLMVNIDSTGIPHVLGPQSHCIKLANDFNLLYIDTQRESEYINIHTFTCVEEVK